MAEQFGALEERADLKPDPPSRRRLPGTRWSAIRINWRWVVQAISLALGIFFFMQAFDTSKSLLMDFSLALLAGWVGWILLFAVCFFALMFTSYLKERGNRTLRKRMAVFEKLVMLLQLDNYSEHSPASHRASQDALTKEYDGKLPI
jgi:hypothetical protein